MKSFKFLFIMYLLVINIVGFIYIYASSIEVIDVLLLLKDCLKCLIFTSLGGGVGVLSYFYLAKPTHFTFIFQLLLWCIIFYQVCLGFWVNLLFRRKKIENY